MSAFAYIPEEKYCGQLDIDCQPQGRQVFITVTVTLVYFLVLLYRFIGLMFNIHYSRHRLLLSWEAMWTLCLFHAWINYYRHGGCFIVALVKVPTYQECYIILKVTRGWLMSGRFSVRSPLEIAMCHRLQVRPNYVFIVDINEISIIVREREIKCTPEKNSSFRLDSNSRLSMF